MCPKNKEKTQSTPSPNLPHLDKGEDQATGLRRIFSEEISNAMRHASVSTEEIPKGVHELRKTLKRTRALLKLMEPDIGEYTVGKEAVLFRDIGRKLSTLRSLYVNLETVKKLRDSLPAKLAGSPLQKTEQLLMNKYQEVLTHRFMEKKVLDAIQTDITCAAERANKLPPLHNDPVILEKALRKSFRKGRKCWRKVARKANSVNMHELRKQIKSLQFQLQMIAALQPKSVNRPVDQLQKLARLSGDDHDLYELIQFVKKYLKDEPLKKELLFRLSRHSNALRKQFLPAARKFYGIKSKKFIANLEMSKGKTTTTATKAPA